MINYKAIKLIVLDVDGTLTDGSVYIGTEGEEFKKFNIKDGLAIHLLAENQMEFMILTGRKSESVAVRAKELKIQHVHQGISDKYGFLKQFMNEKQLYSENVAYIGDDLNDFKVMKLAGFTAAPQNAAKEILESVDYVAESIGGHGAVREILEYLMTERGEWGKMIEKVYDR